MDGNDYTTQLGWLSSTSPLEQVAHQVHPVSSAQALEESVRVSPIKSTDLIEIRARHQHAAESANVVHGIIEAYREHREGEAIEGINEMLGKLQESIDRYESRVGKYPNPPSRMIQDLLHRPPGVDIPPFNNPDLAPDRKRQQEIGKLNGLRQMKRNLQQQLMILEPVVLIHQQPSIPTDPIPRHFARNLALGTSSGLLAGLLLALPLIAILNRRKRT